MRKNKREDLVDHITIPMDTYKKLLETKNLYETEQINWAGRNKEVIITYVYVPKYVPTLNYYDVYC